MKRETENKQYTFSFKKGHTLPMSDEYLDFLEKCQKALLIGNLRGMIVDNNDDGKPSFFQTTGIGDKKAKMALTFYKRFSDINKFTHFLVHEDDLQYYKDFIENFALENCQIITHRLRGKSTEYKIAFVPPVVSRDFKSSFNIRKEYLQDMETLAKFEVGSAEQDKQIKYMLQKYVAICLNYTDGKLNEVYTDHGNITVIVYKDNEMFTNVYYKVNRTTGEKIEFRDFDNIPKMFNARINGFKGKKTMTYDFILMNPPYDKNLHLKIVEQSIPMLTDDGILVNLSPIRWLQDPTVFIRGTGDYFGFEKTISKYIKDIKWLSLFDMEEMFENVDVDAAIYVITKEGGFDYEKYAHNTIFDKVSMKGNFISKYIEKDKIDGIRVRINPSLAHNKSSTRKNSESVIKGQYEYLHYSLSFIYENGYSVVNGKFWSKNRMPGAGNKVMPEGTPIPQSVKFYTIKEAVNFENSTKTMFYRYLTLILKRANNPDYVPFMDDCINPRTGLKGYEGEWTDDDFRKYFDITDSEWEEIERVMKPYL